eukprot:TRINITY_DN23838_c0_g2_i1.p1 TRINITY_DN23838_c0_g2~~TRINITY_DN23838_c0_g2_i1.p1  ORF type:complete len:980 (+),score=235.02 TRINITY_DN23838_c0_g2_i1:232-3171(+)
MGDQQSRPATAFLTAAGDGKGAVRGGSGAFAVDGAGNPTQLDTSGNGGDAAAARGAAPASRATGISGSAAVEEPLPSESEILAKLVTVLGQCPGRTLGLEEIRDNLPLGLRRLAEDISSIQRWLERFPGLMEVTGAPGQERVALTVGRPLTTAAAPAVQQPLEPGAVDPSASRPAAQQQPFLTPGYTSTTDANDASPAGAAVADGAEDALDDEASNPCTVQLRGLPYRATVVEIKAFLGVHAQHLSAQEPCIRLLLNRDGRPSGFAKVQFKSPEAAKACREALHRQPMGDRYVEVLACTERNNKVRNRNRAGEVDVVATSIVATPTDANTEAMERERILQECRDHMRMPGRNQLLLSMLGIALSAPARAYLRRANLGLKHFLARFPAEFRIDGPKGCERVIWCPGFDYGSFVQNSAVAIAAAIAAGASHEVATAAALAAGAPPETAPAMAAAAAAVAAATRGASHPWSMPTASLPGMGYGHGADDQAANALATLEAASTAATAAAAAATSQQASTTSCGSARGGSGTPAPPAPVLGAAVAEPSTPKLRSPVPHKNTGGSTSAHLMATPSDWGTPGIGDHSRVVPPAAAQPAAAAAAAGAQASLAANPAMDMSAFAPGWSPYSWPPPWTTGWPPPWSDPTAMGKAEAVGVNGAFGAMGAGAGKRAASGTAAVAAAPGAAAASAAAAAASGSTSRSHAHLHPHSHPFAHLPRENGAGDSGSDGRAVATTNGGPGANSGGDEGGSPCLRLRGLPFSMTVQDVLAFFAQHDVADRIADSSGATQLLPKANGRPSGQAVVRMRSRQDAEAAQEALSNQWIGGRYIEVFAYGGDGEAIGSSAAPAITDGSDSNALAAAAAPAMPMSMPIPPPPPLAGVGANGGAHPWGNMAWAGLLPPPVPGAAACGGMAPLTAPPPAGQGGADGTSDDSWSALFNFLYSDPNGNALPGAAGGMPVLGAPGASAGTTGVGTTGELAAAPRATLQV